MTANINTAEGLSSARTYSVVEGRDGAIWIATKAGVDRYNGQTVKNYRLSESLRYCDASGLTIRLFHTPQGDLYAYDNKGHIYTYSPFLETFVLRYNLASLMGGSWIVNAAALDHRGTLWVATDRGLCRVCREGRASLLLRGHYLYDVESLSMGLTIGAADGVYLLRGAQVRKVTSDAAVLSMYEDRARHLIWLGTFHDGVKVYRSDTFRPVPVVGLEAVPQMPVRALIVWDHRTLLFGIDGAGVYSYDFPTHKALPLLNTDGRPDNSLQGNGVYCLLRDHTGNLWIASYTGGIDLACPTGNDFSFVRHEYLNSQSLINNSVNDILMTPDGRLWYATDDGISIYDGKTGHWAHTLYNKVVLSLCALPSGTILAATYGNGVYAVNGGEGRLIYGTALGNLKTNYVYSLLLDSRGGLWIGCLDGPLTHVTGSRREEYPIQEIQCMVESPDHRTVIVGTTHGCYRINETTGRQTRFFYPEQYPGAIYNYFVNALAFDGPDRLWIATDGGGLYCYHPSTRRVENLTTHQGLPSNVVSSLIWDDRHQLWMGTDRGLACLHGRTVGLVNYVKGFECEYKRMAAAYLRGGRLAFGSCQGAVIINPRQILGLSYEAPLRITDIRVEGVPVDSAWRVRFYPMFRRHELTLSHQENTLTVSFESINYRCRNDIEYQCFLEGYDHQWSALFPQQDVRFANLPPGDYTLHVKSVSKSSLQVLGEATLHITIHEPWWNTLWAWTAYLQLIGWLVYMGWDYYRGRLRQRYDREKIDFFINTTHNIRTPLTLVLAPLRDIAADDTLSARSRKFLQMARENGNRLMTMISGLLDFQKADIGHHEDHPQLLSVSAILHEQQHRFDLVASEKGIQLTTESPDEDLLLMADKTILDLVFENLISNAIKYTPRGGTVLLRATAAAGRLSLAVCDTGIGIPRQDRRQLFSSFFRASNADKGKGYGLGLRITRQLVSRLGGELSWTSEEGRGTTFTVTLPLLSPHQATTETSGEEKGKDTLLFVDDNESLRQYMRMAFSPRYHVVTASDGEAALAYLRDSVCDIVVSDIMMPGIQGDELCRRIKENKDTAWLPVILLTAKSGKDFMIDGLHQGADDYIAKPFDADILAEKISSILANRRRLSDYYLRKSMEQARQTMKKRKNAASPTSTSLADSGEDVSSSPSEPVDPKDQAFVAKATQLVLDHISDNTFTIDRLCREMAMSRTLFYGRLKTLTGQSPQDFIRLLRLERAATLLRDGVPVLDVSIRTGFVNAKYFSTVFKKHFGVSPSKYR